MKLPLINFLDYSANVNFVFLLHASQTKIWNFLVNVGDIVLNRFGLKSNTKTFFRANIRRLSKIVVDCEGLMTYHETVRLVSKR